MATLLVLLGLVWLAVAAQYLGVDSRPGFGDGGSDYKERWFIHSKDD